MRWGFLARARDWWKRGLPPERESAPDPAAEPAPPDVDQLSPLVLAYVGDAVYELFVRTHLLRQEARVGDLHLAARELVRAATQARILRSLEPELREEEKRVARRGRNTKSGSIPKSATVSEYRHATGFECLLGYLFLTGQDDRLLELLTRAVEVGQGPGDGMEAEG